MDAKTDIYFISMSLVKNQNVLIIYAVENLNICHLHGYIKTCP